MQRKKSDEFWQQQQRQTDDILGQQSDWYLVEGTVERGKAIAGVRFELIRLAAEAFGYYPQGKHVDDAFLVGYDSTDADKRLISVSVVFKDMDMADRFIRNVDTYITTTAGPTIRGRFNCSTTASFEGAEGVFTSHYTPREADGDPPMYVAYSSVDMSSKATSYAMEDTVLKYQRIEADAAFVRDEAESAHIFPRAKCKRQFWLCLQGVT